MTTTSRLNNLLLNQDWTRIYQTFKNADFKSYDFENLRRVIITYLRENYPEDFNDYIESSEYLALIDAIAFLGQSLAFRIDLASRENFIELAERKESVLRIARMLSYNAKRNKAASGLLKFDTISTTENVLDNNGRDLSQQVIVWNDPTNPNWAEQFVAILNAAMADNTEFGRSQGTATIQGVLTDQYRLRSTGADVPIYTYTKTVSGRTMIFEIVSTSFKNSETLYEEDPYPGNQLGFIFRQDGKGAGSANTGFYMLFKQGSLELADFTIDVPTTNEIVSIGSENVNDDDVWLFKLDSIGQQIEQWTKVSNLVGNNIAYNSIERDIRNIFSAVTKSNDKIDLIFADGVYGNLPRGTFRAYYRVSNGLVYNIAPSDMRGITINVPYANKQGVAHTLTITMSLKTTVSNATASEDIDSIRSRAPAQYYTQNRMITAEDYNLAPLSASQDILKVRSVNRTSSGVSRNFDIIDATGKYSSVTVFGDDGLIYKNERERSLSSKFGNRIDIINFIRQRIEPLFTEAGLYNFYLTKYNKIIFTDQNTVWENVTSDINQSTGYFKNLIDNSLLKVGDYTTNTLKYAESGSLIKFIPPAGKAFKKGQIVDVDPSDPDQTDRIWAKVIRTVGDGTNAGRGVLQNGTGPVILNELIPSGAIAIRIVPRFVNDLPSSLEVEIVNLAFSNLNFGLRYDIATTEWKIISAANLDLINNFNLGKTGDTTNSNLDSSWLIAFVKEADEYVVRIRSMFYVFSSLESTRFYFDVNQKIYDSKTGRTVKDQIKVLGINTGNDFITPLKQDLLFEVDDSIRYDDGYESASEIQVAFYDTDDDGVIDNPESFEQIVGEDIELNYLFFKEVLNEYGDIDYEYIDNSDDEILIYNRESTINVNDFEDGQLIYFYDTNEDRVKRVDRNTNTLILESSYRANIGRDKIKFQYFHNANVDRRIDPSVSNIIDVYLLPRSYDAAFRTYLAGGTLTEPLPPTTEDLRLSFGRTLGNIKSLSDEIIYHPVRYKILFGSKADERLRAQFKVVKNSTVSINDNDLKVRIILAINEFFDINNWDFGDRFYVAELITYITNSVAPDVSNIALVPRQPEQSFGSLFEIQSRADEIFISGATVDDVVIVSSISASEIGVPIETFINSTNN
jgi:hypothetical protein